MPWKRGNRLKVVSEKEARGRVLEIYQEIKTALGIPYVNVLFQAYGVYPEFLELHWRALQPVVETQEFFRLADRLRADAYTRMHNYFEIPDLCVQAKDLRLSQGAQQELTGVVQVLHYNDPLLLLIAAIQMQAFDSRTGQQGKATIPADHPVFNEKPLLVDEEIASPNLLPVYDEIKKTLGLPFVNLAFRALARWPDFLLSYWQVLKEIMQSPVYIESLHGLRDTAWGLAREVPRPVELTISQLIDAGVKDDDVGAIVRITELFVKTLTSLVLNIAMAKIGLEGGNGRTHVSPTDQPQPGRAA